MSISQSPNLQNKSPKTISCDGGSKTSGHPLIYLKFNKDGYAICPYCQKVFSNKSPKQD